MNKENLLLIFTKNPVAGKVKTRLAKGIGEEKALEVYKFLLKHSHKITAPLTVEKQVHYSNSITEEDLWSEGNFQKKLQVEGDLGEKMMAAFKVGFEEGYRNIIIVGSDLFDISSKDIENAFEALESHEYVIGPAEDGGYYLLGMKSLNSALFQDKEWSTSSVFEDTLKNMQQEKVQVLQIRNDIDTLDDIKDHPAFQKFIK